MSAPVFKDFDKAVADIFGDDFDLKYTLKIKSSGPLNTTITTNTQYDTKENKLKPKTTIKYPHSSGFTVDKLEFSPDCKMTIETSLAGVAPGLKLEFKGNDSDKADLSAKYTHPLATVTGEVDVANFSGIKASACANHGPIVAGVSTDIKIAKSNFDSASFDFGVGYSIPSLLFVGAKASKNLSAYSANLSYEVAPHCTFAGLVNYSAKATTATVAGTYQANPATFMKLKASSTGVLSASVKQSFEKKFTVVGSAEVPSDMNGVKFGINATLG